MASWILLLRSLKGHQGEGQAVSYLRESGYVGSHSHTSISFPGLYFLDFYLSEISRISCLEYETNTIPKQQLFGIFLNPVLGLKKKQNKTV